MLAVVAVALGIIAWIAFAGAAGKFIGHPAWSSDDDGDRVDVR